MSRTYRLPRVEVRLLRDSQSPTWYRPVRNVQDALDALAGHISGQATEWAWALYLDAGLKPVGAGELGRGGVSCVYLSARVVAQQALALNAAAVILAHNHPSGDTTPSEADVRATREVTAALKALDITVLDHVVVGLGPFTGATVCGSMREKGLL